MSSPPLAFHFLPLPFIFLLILFSFLIFSETESPSQLRLALNSSSPAPGSQMLESQRVLPQLAEGRRVFTESDRAEANHLLMGCGVWARGPIRLSFPDSLAWVMSSWRRPLFSQALRTEPWVAIGSHPAADGSLGTGERGPMSTAHSRL